MAPLEPRITRLLSPTDATLDAPSGSTPDPHENCVGKACRVHLVQGSGSGLSSEAETLLRSRAFAFRDRRARKRDFRRLWITRLSAACRERGLRYSEFIHGLAAAGIELNRKSLSELAIHEPAVFDEIVAVAREAAVPA